MSKRLRRNHSPAFKAKVSLAAGGVVRRMWRSGIRADKVAE